MEKKTAIIAGGVAASVVAGLAIEHHLVANRPTRRVVGGTTYATKKKSIVQKIGRYVTSLIKR